MNEPFTKEKGPKEGWKGQEKGSGRKGSREILGGIRG